MHERESIDDLGEYRSKTSRTYVDRLLPWLDDHAEQPFFVFLHVFDPHSPFRPMHPHDVRWLNGDAVARHEEDLGQVEEVAKIFHHLPSAEQLAEAEVDSERLLTAEKAWYDGSIRAINYEIARLLERLEELGLRDDTLIAFVADHGEDFLEHGNHPLDLINLADDHHEVVADLRGEIERWRAMAEAARVTPDGEEGDVSSEELEQLRALGYAN